MDVPLFRYPSQLTDAAHAKGKPNHSSDMMANGQYALDGMTDANNNNNANVVSNFTYNVANQLLTVTATKRHGNLHL